MSSSAVSTLPLVASFAGAWIETKKPPFRASGCCRSPPSRGRGLKLDKLVSGIMSSVSPPSRGRGLKQGKRKLERLSSHVASFAGAWIETARTGSAKNKYRCRLLRGGVD